MKHYIVIMSELAYFQGTYKSEHFISDTEWDGFNPTVKHGNFIAQLEDQQYRKIPAPTIEELWLDSVGKVSIFVFSSAGEYIHSGFFSRMK